jgi:hypothetical protein
VAVLPVLVVVALAVAVGGVLAAARRAGRSPEVAVTAARRHGLTVAVLAPVAGVVAVVLLLGAGADVGHGFPGSIGDALVLAPLAYALAHTLVLLVGELTWPRPAGAVRRARLTRRRLADVAPRRLLRVLVGATAALVAAIGVGAALAAPGGHTFEHRDGPFLKEAGPWPGWHYGRPVTVELVLLVAVLAGALWVVVNRPAVATDDERVEAALRRTSAHRILRGASAGVLVLAGGFIGRSGSAAWSVNALSWWPGLLVTLLGDAALVAALVVLCLPAPRLPVGAPPVPVG